MEGKTEGNLVIVESPAKARTIQKFLGDGYVVKPSFGHIRDLQDSKLSVDVEHGFHPEYVIPGDKKKVVSELKKAAGKADTVWLASDEDREGEAISWHLSEVLGLDSDRTRRIVFHEITKDAILNAIENPREIDINLVNAQQARRVLDRLVGFELSPVLWRKIQRGLSAGRVQSVALRLVVDREKEIIAFSSKPYFKVDAVFETGGNQVKGTLDTRFDDIDGARAFLEDSRDATYTISEADKKEATRHPAPPFTTSTLQQEASRKLRFPVSVTMRVAQTLYERGLITYMRTDSTNLSKLAVSTAKKFIKETYGPEYSHPRQYRTSSKGAQEAHEAIRPTFIENTGIEGTEQEKKLYALIWKRTVASQMEDAKILNTTIKVSSDKRSEKFSIRAAEVIFDGFLKLYIEGMDDDGGDEDENGILPQMNIGDRLNALCITSEGKFSRPPARYSEATLVRKLEELGIGRPSTYAPTISTLTKGRGYIVKTDVAGQRQPTSILTLKNGRITEKKTETVTGAEKGKFVPQEIGMIVSDYLVENFPSIMDYDFTARVEKDFDNVAAGKKAWNSVISDFYGSFHDKVENTLQNGRYTRTEKVLGTAPDGETVTARFGQFGPYVQKGEGDGRQYASLGKGQLIETLTLEDALELFRLPRNVGEKDGTMITVTKGRYGPYIKYGDRNISLPRDKDPLTVSLEECCEIIDKAAEGPAAKAVIQEFAASGISVMNGRYGPYLKYDGQNYKLPKGTDAQAITEEECKKIVESQAPTSSKGRRRKN